MEVDIDKYEDWLEALYWDFDSKGKGNLSDRDVFKGFLRSITRKVLEDQLLDILRTNPPQPVEPHMSADDADDLVYNLIKAHDDYIASVSYEGLH
jgi:hypothetical protein